MRGPMTLNDPLLVDSEIGTPDISRFSGWIQSFLRKSYNM